MGKAVVNEPAKLPLLRPDRGKLVRGLFAGGTFCAEAQIVFRQAGLAVASNVPTPGASPIDRLQSAAIS